MRPITINSIFPCILQCSRKRFWITLATNKITILLGKRLYAGGEISKASQFNIVAFIPDKAIRTGSRKMLAKEIFSLPDNTSPLIFASPS